MLKWIRSLFANREQTPEPGPAYRIKDYAPPRKPVARSNDVEVPLCWSHIGDPLALAMGLASEHIRESESGLVGWYYGRPVYIRVCVFCNAGAGSGSCDRCGSYPIFEQV